MDNLTTQALDIVFQSEGVKDMKKKATPYVTGVLLFHIIIFAMLLYLIFRVTRLEKLGQSGGV